MYCIIIQIKCDTHKKNTSKEITNADFNVNYPWMISTCDSMFGACDGVQLGGELIDKFSTLVRDQYRRASVSANLHSSKIDDE